MRMIPGKVDDLGEKVGRWGRDRYSGLGESRRHLLQAGIWRIHLRWWAKKQRIANRKVDLLLGACGSLFVVAFMFTLKYPLKSSAKSEVRERVVWVWVLWPQFEVSTVHLVERFYPAIFCYPYYVYFHKLTLPYVFSELFFKKKNEALKWISFIYSLVCLILWTDFVMLIAQLYIFLRLTIGTALSSFEFCKSK